LGPGTLSDEALQVRVYGPPTPATHRRAVSDCAYLHGERRKPGIALELVHLEYLEQHADARPCYCADRGDHRARHS
jgi:hypothetical protein